jgi:hypothetical protein
VELIHKELKSRIYKELQLWTKNINLKKK